MERGADVGFASDELDGIAPGAGSMNRTGHWSLWSVVATHGIQRDANHLRSLGTIIVECVRTTLKLDDIRRVAADIARSATLVRIRPERIEPYATSLPLERVRAPELDPATHYLREPAGTLAYLVQLDAINFGSGYFPWLRKREGMSGYFTVAACLKDAFETRGPLSAADLSELTPAECARIFGQADALNEATAELMELFARALNDLGTYVSSDFGGSFAALVESAHGSAERLVGILAHGMPFYRDVPFYKRAQLTAADLATAGVASFDDLDRLTIFADNLVPHVLRVDGVLEYDAALLARIDREELIASGSVEEREIRGCALHAVELIADALRTRRARFAAHAPAERDERTNADSAFAAHAPAERTERANHAGAGVAVTAMQLDYLLWNRGQEPAYKAIPRHRARTVYY